MKDIKELISFGVINIDKPIGPTSFSVTEFIRRSLGVSKASHMGTLDPKVTGVLPILIGRACRLASYIIGSDKTYVGILHTHKEQDTKEIQDIINKNFVGKIKQTPPHKSAVKRAEREREVYYFDILEGSETKRDFLFKCKVEGGTYIRKICSDLGEKIGGAHMGELRRVQAGVFGEENIYSLYEFEDATKSFNEGDETKLRKMIIDANEIIKKVLPFVGVKKESIKKLLSGKPLYYNDLIDELKVNYDGYFLAFFEDKLVGVYKRVDREDIVGKPEFVNN